ncbi:isochorismate synthase [Halomarina oriensis]|uniref:isochorismate synthase n=1 Tax=Halomarina oriensis TaxID=671145 RepID=A0A6B0GQ90_9EURY|nr:isochorismate synthase [Halomarina oriensis]MWG36830.1 isochorismate synthase [Halomarina oriensis]
MEFAHSSAATSLDGTLVTRTCEVPDVSYRAFLSAHGTPHVHWSTPDGVEVVGSGAAVAVTGTGEGRFETVRERAGSVFDAMDADASGPARPRMLGGVAFSPDHGAAPPWSGFPAAQFLLPERQLTRTDETTFLTVSRYGPDVTAESVEAALDAAREDVAVLPAMVPSGDPPGVVGTAHLTTREEWHGMVETAVDRIESGDLRKVVLALALTVDLDAPVDVPSVLERLRRTYPECYRFLVQPTDAAGFFGAPPERLVRLRDRAVETEALAGSAARGDTPEADADLAAELVESEKIQHEQGLVVDAIRDQLEPLGAVAVGDQHVHRLATIQHLRTPIEATLDDDRHVLDIVSALHPTPAVGGLPPDVAQRVIHETESFDRGWYAAPVGWFDAGGDGEFAVAIRSGVAGGREATLFAGNGIVADSDPAAEWDEVRLKYRPILDELGHGDDVTADTDDPAEAVERTERATGDDSTAE